MSTESVNPNISLTDTQTTTDGKMELNSGSGPVSFDELEQIERESKKAKSQAKKKESQDLSSDDKKGEVKKETKEPKESKEPKSETSKEEKAEAKEEPAKRKTVKGKYGDTEYDLDEEAVFNVKTNGKEEPWTLKELLADKSGKTAWDKKFSELDKYHRGIKAQDLKLKETSEKLKSIFSETDPSIRMYKMAEIAGVDPVAFQQKFYEDNIPLLEKWYSMSEDEKRAWKSEQAAQHYKFKADTLESSKKAEEAQRALKSKVDALRASHQISEDEFLNQYDQVKDMVDKGEIEAQLTPEYVIETIKKDRLWKAAEEKLNELNLLTGNERGERLLTLIEKAHALEMSPQEIAEWVDENWGTKKAQKAVEEKKKDREDFISGKKEVAQVKQASSAPVFFDEM